MARARSACASRQAACRTHALLTICDPVSQIFPTLTKKTRWLLPHDARSLPARSRENRVSVQSWQWLDAHPLSRTRRRGRRKWLVEAMVLRVEADRVEVLLAAEAAANPSTQPMEAEEPGEEDPAQQADAAARLRQLHAQAQARYRERLRLAQAEAEALRLAEIKAEQQAAAAA